jgi:hypothetical protein
MPGYDQPVYRQIDLGAVDLTAGATRYFSAGYGKAVRVRDIEAEWTVNAGGTTAGSVTVGKAGAVAKAASMPLRTDGAAGDVDRASVLKPYGDYTKTHDDDAIMTQADDAPFLITVNPYTGGTPAGTARITVFVVEY